MTGKIFRKPWMEDKDKEKLLKIARKAIQDFHSNPNKFFNMSVIEGDDIIVCVDATVEFMHLIQDLKQIAKMIRKT